MRYVFVMALMLFPSFAFARNGEDPDIAAAEPKCVLGLTVPAEPGDFRNDRPEWLSGWQRVGAIARPRPARFLIGRRT